MRKRVRRAKLANEALEPTRGKGRPPLAQLSVGTIRHETTAIYRHCSTYRAQIGQREM